MQFTTFTKATDSQQTLASKTKKKTFLGFVAFSFKCVILPHSLSMFTIFNAQLLSEQEQDLASLKQFILKKRPQVVVVAAECRETMSVVDDVKMCIAELEQENQIPTISVEALDGEVARVFMSSPRSEVF